MYCKHCGQQIDDNSTFCNMCGKAQTRTNSQMKLEMDSSNQFKPSTLKFLSINIVFIISYFLDWIKFTGESGSAAAFLSFYADINIKSLSPNIIINGFEKIKSLASLASEGISVKYYLIYLLIIYPILAGLALILCLLKKTNASVLSSRISAIISCICLIVTWYLTTSSEVGATIWLYLATAATVYGFFVISEYVRNNVMDYGNEEFISDEEKMSIDALEAAELAVMPENKRNKILAKNENREVEVLENKHMEENLEFCFYCGANLEGYTDKCPSCNKSL